MGRLRAAFETIGKQLGALPLAGKLLFASFGVIIVMALLLVAVQSSKQSLVELMPGATPEEQVRAKDALDTFGIAYKMENGRLMVAPDIQRRALGMLGEAGKLPQNTQMLFSNLLQQNNWMDSRSQTEFKQNQALNNELSLIIGNFRNVESARVLIDAPEPVGIGMAYRKPTASVALTMKAGKTLDREMVDAVAAMVAGARAGLSVTDVKVIDQTSGRQYTARSAADYRSGDYLELVAKIEERVQSKVLDAVSYIPKVIVAVTAQADVTRVTRVTNSVLPLGKGSVKTETRETSKETSDTTGGPGAEPGLRSNTGDDISRGGGGGSAGRSTSSNNDTEFKVAMGSENMTVADPKGFPTKINVVISIPREYVAMLLKQEKATAGAGAGAAGAGGGGGGGGGGGAGNDAEPTQAEIEARFTAEKERLERDLQALIATTAVESGAQANAQQRMLTVSLIPVPMNIAITASGAMVGMVGGGGGGVGGGIVGELLSGSTIRTVALGAVALAAMGMMLMLVKRSAKPIELPTAQEVVGLPPALESQSDLVGEADEGAAAMVGIELDDEELKYKKMLEQVQDMVKKSPSDAAALLNRWVATEE